MPSPGPSLCLVEHGWSRRETARLRLNPPSILLFLIAFVLATLVTITKLGFIHVPRCLPHQEYRQAFTACVVLIAGTLVRGF